MSNIEINDSIGLTDAASDDTNDTTLVEMPVQKFDETNKNGCIFPSNVSSMKDYLESKGISDEEATEIIDETLKEDENNKELITDEDHPLTEFTREQIGEMIRQSAQMVEVFESNWRESEKTFKLKDEHMKKLYKFNLENRVERPDYLTSEEEEKWDDFNGLDKLTDEDIIDIFGEDHPIIGVQHDQTIDRIKDVSGDFFNWLNSVKEYNAIQSAYMELIEIEEEKEIDKLKIIADKETDPEKKAKMQSSIDEYYSNKYLDFLRDELPEKDRKMLIDAYGDNKKCEYWINRSRDKMKQLKINNKFILEISQFEKRFLPEKYHAVSNMLLLYFMKTIVYSNASNPKDLERTRSIAMVLALDGIVRNVYKDERKEKILNNIMAYLDQVYDDLVSKYGLNSAGDDNSSKE